MINVATAIRPSSTAPTARVVNRSWIGPIEPKRDSTSPSWCFSNQFIGRRTSRLNKSPTHCRFK